MKEINLQATYKKDQQRQKRRIETAKDTQCVAVCCSVLQCVAVRRSVLQWDAVCCSETQCVAVRRSVLQWDAVCCSETPFGCHLLRLQHTATHCNTLQHTATRLLCAASAWMCCMLQRVAVCCSVLQCPTLVKETDIKETNRISQ